MAEQDALKFHRRFIGSLTKNYMLGSLIAVFGVGGVFIFTTLRITGNEVAWLVGTLLISGGVMVSAELLMFRYQLLPIRTALLGPAPTVLQLQRAFNQTHQLPMLTVKRIIGPHLLGLCVPAVALSIIEIHQKLIRLPYVYVLLAVIGSILVAGMHALVEFFLTQNAIQPVIVELERLAIRNHHARLSMDGHITVSIRRKFQFSTVMVGTFPLLLFGLATQIRLTQTSTTEGTAIFWQWAAVILLMGVAFASYAAWLLTESVRVPIEDLTARLHKVESGEFDVRATEAYSDEFSRLIKGFNHMVTGLAARDSLNNQLIESYFSTLAAALDARDPYTSGHSIRVAHLSVGIGLRFGLSEDEIGTLRKSALLHDIGKIGVRDSILLKDGKLSDEEFAMMKQHPVIGESILLQIQPAEYMKPLLPGVRWHHERYDGKGYPDGLLGDEIPLFPRIMAVADAFDAMTSDRPYRSGMSVTRATEILREGKGTQWDPVFSQILIDWIKEDSEVFQTSLGLVRS